MSAATDAEAAIKLRNTLERLHLRYQGLSDGKVADYIPELAKADPNWFGIAAVTVSGSTYTVGDCDVPFTIQSAVNPLIYGLALESQGAEVVEGRVGVEPSGNPFNSISLDPRGNIPYNPMVNAGALCLTDLVPGADPTARLNKVLESVSAYAGRPVEVDMAVFSSELATGHRNHAIAYLLTNFKLLRHQAQEVLDLYYQQCSIRVSCLDLATIGATLANRGTNPLTGQQAIEPTYIRNILSVMFTCGMYEVAGQWAYDVGLPAKSGVGGGLVAVVPGLMGLAVFSPPLDATGATTRGTRVLRDLIQELDLHMMDVMYGEQEFGR